MRLTRKFKISLITIVIAFAIGVSVWTSINSSYFQQTTLDIPDAGLEKLFFQLINRTTTLAKLEKLREKRPHKNDEEIRIWRGFGLRDLEGMIFRKSGGFWIAYHIKTNDPVMPTKAKSFQLYGVPKSGWNSFNKRILALDVLTIPDASETSCNTTDFLDGTSYVVEISRKNTYRTYMYHAGNENQCQEGKQMANIARLVVKEFFKE